MSPTWLWEQTRDAFTKLALSYLTRGHFNDCHPVFLHPAAAQDLPEDPRVHPAARNKTLMPSAVHIAFLPQRVTNRKPAQMQPQSLNNKKKKSSVFLAQFLKDSQKTQARW